MIIRNCREACREFQSGIRLASYLVRAPNSRSERHELKSPVLWELGALTNPWDQVFYSCKSQLDHIMPDMYHSPDAMLLYTDTQVQYQRGTGGSYVEKPAEILRQASG